MAPDSPAQMQFDERLAQIKAMLVPTKLNDAERALMSLLDRVHPDVLRMHRSDLLEVADQFTGYLRPGKRPGKRTKRLREKIEDILEKGTNSMISVGFEQTVPDCSTGTTSPALSRSSLPEAKPEGVGPLRKALEELSDRHIFQWSTFYQDRLAEHFDRLLHEISTHSLEHDSTSIASAFAEHSRDIFSKGYNFVRRNTTSDEALRKSLNGLSHFLDLIVRLYSSRRSSSNSEHHECLRLLVSSAIRGILEGYGSVQFGDRSGYSVLPVWQRQWLRYIVFVTQLDGTKLVENLERGSLKAGLQSSLLPFLRALERVSESIKADGIVLPVASSYIWARRRFDITLRCSRLSGFEQSFEATVFLEEGFFGLSDVEDAIGRQARLVIAPLGSDVLRIIKGRARLSKMVVSAKEQEPGEVSNLAFEVLRSALPLGEESPMLFNVARDFPLKRPGLLRFFQVHRTSVRRLLQTSERSTGIRLWCSVRRSGKTTACFHMASTYGDSEVIPQTCGPKQQDNDDTFLYGQIREVLRNGDIIDPNFVVNAISTCSPSGDIQGKKVVLIVDEYESLFGLLRTSLERKPDLRYPVIEPLLNQLTEFSRDNLLVFLGQQPDAYFLLMSQNQLAPLIEQDTFPLFVHDASVGEFAELVRRILPGNAIRYSPAFVDALYRETAGHPWLTITVLDDFNQWLIDDRNARAGVQVSDTDFQDFVQARLGPTSLFTSGIHRVTREMVTEAIKLETRQSEPWLYSVYRILQQICQINPESFRVSRVDFDNMIRSLPLPSNALNLNRLDILRTASKANFLFHDEEWVGVRVRTLGRLASAAATVV